MAYDPFVDPDSRIDYKIDWSDELNGDVIVSSEWFSDRSDITIDTVEYDGTQSVVWIKDVIDGETYELTNRIHTAEGRVEDQTITVIGRQK